MDVVQPWIALLPVYKVGHKISFQFSNTDHPTETKCQKMQEMQPFFQGCNEKCDTVVCDFDGQKFIHIYRKL